MDVHELEVETRKGVSKLVEKYRDLRSEYHALRSLYGLLAEKALAAGVTHAPLQGSTMNSDETALRMGLLVTQNWLGFSAGIRYAICEDLIKAGASETDLGPEWRTSMREEDCDERKVETTDNR